MQDAAVVILNYNGRNHLEQYLPSVVEHSEGAEIVVADNASTDDSVDFLKANYPDITLLIMDTNTGFAGGYNRALKQVDAQYYVLLNSDVEVTEGWLYPIVSLMTADGSVAACQPKILAWREKDAFEYAGACGGFIDRYGFPFCRGRMFNDQEKDAGQYNDQREVFWATGACLFIRAKLFHEAGGFDDYFFAHMEEIDLCWRLKRLGHKIMVCPESTVYHLGGGTLANTNPRKTFLNFRNNLLTLYKNLPSKHVFPVLILKLTLDGVAAFKFLVDSGFGHFIAVIKAHFAFYGQLGRYSKIRAELKATMSDKPMTQIYRRSVVRAFFLSGKKKFSELEADRFRQ